MGSLIVSSCAGLVVYLSFSASRSWYRRNPKYIHLFTSVEKSLIYDTSSSFVPVVERLPTLMEHQNAAGQWSALLLGCSEMGARRRYQLQSCKNDYISLHLLPTKHVMWSNHDMREHKPEKLSQHNWSSDVASLNHFQFSIYCHYISNCISEHNTVKRVIHTVI